MRHGGDLAAAEAEFGRPREGWLDLSTGVNPNPYPVPPFEAETLARLPDPADLEALIQVARGRYGWADAVSVAAGAGAQAMIQALPRIRPRASVAVVGQTYGEHSRAWTRAGHRVRIVEALDPGEAEILVLVNPDNPTGRTVEPERLMEVASGLAERGGLLIVDEAFADATPEIAIGRRLEKAGAVVLRSFGKFFGLAGLRLGFAAGDEATVEALKVELGPWPVNGPAIAAARLALADEPWIRATQARLRSDAARVDAILEAAGFSESVGCHLFRTARHPQARAIHVALARAGVWCRAFDERPDQLRFGLPGADEDYVRLESALKAAL